MPLDPELAAHLEREKALPARGSLSVEATRARMTAANNLAEKAGSLAREDDHRIGQLRLHDYWPADDPSLPIVVFLHGGRFFSGGIESHHSMCRFLSVFAGCRVMAVEYRLAPEHPFPAAIEDTLRAVDHACKEASRVAVFGDSAGACLAAVAALERPSVSCQVLLYPMLDPACAMPSHRLFASGYGPGSEDMRRGWTLYAPDGCRDPRLSPLFATDLRGAPPAFVLTAEYDCLRDEGEEYAKRLRRAGCDVKATRVAGAIHGFAGLTSVSRLGRTAIVDAGEYLFEQMRGDRG